MRINDRVLTKVVKLLSKFFPYNTKYRPKGVISLKTLMENNAVRYHEINASYSSRLTLTPEFINDCSSYNKPTLQVEYPGDHVVEIPGGRIYNIDSGNIAVVTGDNLLIEDFSFQWRSAEKLAPAVENIIFEKKMFSTPKRYSGRVFSLLSGGGAENYYYHWVVDSIPKLHLLKQTGRFSQIDYFLVPNYTHKFQIEYLNFLGVPKEKIINANEVRHIQAETLIVTSYIRIMAHLPQWVPDFLYKVFNAAPQVKRDKLIYIARGDAAVNRKVLNEIELIEMLKQQGFEIHFLSSMSVIQQAHLFNSAKLIVASHGGGLTNLVFCEAGTQVLEFFPDNYVNHLFYDICNKRQLEYQYLVCPSSDFTGKDLERALANVVANVEAIREKVIAFEESVTIS